MKKIIIMDYGTTEVHIFPIKKKHLVSSVATEAFIESKYSEHGRTFNIKEVSYMIVDLKTNEGRLPIYIH